MEVPERVLGISQGGFGVAFVLLKSHPIQHIAQIPSGCWRHPTRARGDRKDMLEDLPRFVPSPLFDPSDPLFELLVADSGL